MVRILPLLLLASLTLAASKPPAIELVLNPRVGFRPLTVEARLYIEPNYQNVAWCLQWYQRGAEFPDGRHCEEINGQYAPRLHFLTIKSLDAYTEEGTYYEVSATVLRTRDTESTPLQTIQVLHRLY